MNELLITLLVVTILLYGLLWHDQPSHPKCGERTVTEAVYDFLLDFYLPTKVMTLAAGFVVAKMPKIIMGLKTLGQPMSSRPTNPWPVGGKLKQKLSP